MLLVKPKFFYNVMVIGLCEFPRVSGLLVIYDEKNVKPVFVRGSYVIESVSGVVHEEDVFFVKDPVITVYEGEVEKYHTILKGEFNGKLRHGEQGKWIELKKRK